jgi:hypothetical protein
MGVTSKGEQKDPHSMRLSICAYFDSEEGYLNFKQILVKVALKMKKPNLRPGRLKLHPPD